MMETPLYTLAISDTGVGFQEDVVLSPPKPWEWC